MLPSLRSGDFVIANKLYISIEVEDVILVNHPTYARIIKRVSKVCQKKGVYLVGDNDESVSSDQMGWVSLSQIQAKVLFSIKAKI